MCNCNSHKVHVFSDKKIKRYMEVCGECGTHIKWVGNSEWEEIKDTAIIMSEDDRKILQKAF